MELFNSVFGMAAGYILPFLFVLTVVVFFHELGHFLVARWCGVRVTAISVGFGPELIGMTDRHGTRWKVAAIPLGGYVKFAGDENAASVPDRERLAAMTEDERKDTFLEKSVGRRAAIVAAGPIANFILAIVIFAGLFALYGKAEIAPKIDAVQTGSAAEVAGLKPGDVVLEIDGRPIASFSELQRVVSTSADIPLQVTIDRGGEILTIEATPERREITDRFGNVQKVGLLGIQRSPAPEDVVVRRYSPVEAVVEGARETWFIVERTGTIVAGMAAGRESADQLGGPLRVAQISGQVATLGFTALLNLAAVLSVSIGLLNLLPIPLLDGGHLLFYAAEAIRGRPLSERVQDVGFRIGIAIILLLMIFGTWNDVAHLATL